MDKQVASVFLFKSGELEALLADISPERNALSPVAAEAQLAAITENGFKVSENVDFQVAASIIASPQIKISAVKGGGSLAIEYFDLLGRIDGRDAKWAALIKNENKTAVLLFNDSRAFIEWFSDTFAVKTDVPMNNLLASKMTLEEWIVLAHTIDAFRRVYMESMLLYRPNREYSVTAEDFIASFNVSLESGDTRWLLPAFFAVTPGLSGIKPNLNAEVLAAAEAYGLVKHGKNPETNGGIFTFTTTGMTLGLEFATSWMYGVGFEAAVLNDEGNNCLPDCFLAPTSLGNHLFFAEKAETREWSISHQALKHTELDEALAAWISKVVDYTAEVKDRKPAEAPLPDESANATKQTEIVAPENSIIGQEALKTAEQPKPAQTQTPQATQVSQPPQAAQNPLGPQASQPQTPRFCMKCGNKVLPGVRFCSKCGNKVA